MAQNYRVTQCSNVIELLNEIEYELTNNMNVPAESRVRDGSTITLKMIDDPDDTEHVITLAPYEEGIGVSWPGRYVYSRWYTLRSLGMNADAIPVDVHIFSSESPRSISVFFNDPVRTETTAGMIVCNLQPTAGDDEGVYMFATGANNTTKIFSTSYPEYDQRELFNINTSLKGFFPNGHDGTGDGSEGCYHAQENKEVGEFWRPDIPSEIFTRPNYQPGGFKLMHPFNVWANDMEVRAVHLGHIADHYRINGTDLNFGQEIEQAGKRFIIIDRHNVAIEIN